MATQSGSTTTGVGSSSAPTILQVIPTTRNAQIWKDFHLCKMLDNTTKTQCIHCFHFFSINSNSTLKNHISHPHCEALKTVPESGQSSMSRDGSVFVYNPDAVREQFAGLVIQEGLSFNHFDNTRMTRVFQNHHQPEYTHVSRTSLKRDAIKLWIAAKQLIKDDFLNLNSSVNITTDVWTAPHNLHEVLIESISIDLEFFNDEFETKAKDRFKTSFKGLYNMYYLKYGQPNQSSNAGSSRNLMTNLLNKLKQNKRAKHDRIATSEYERYVKSDYVSHLSTEELAGYDVLGFWKPNESMFHVISQMARDILSVQDTSVASESAFSTSGRVLSIRRTRLTLASLEMCECVIRV
ncbi:zinc finger BED domain-containing protein RICESLEEPER 2 [Tanacetum coccineum]|uniref:Zinc finger BED domain-containing protein RICESLEEPER 2 n=1 Tax=Tanacetum coccineum TaxID=301880 RepID=A0ABQ5E678_9ASTR